MARRTFKQPEFDDRVIAAAVEHGVTSYAAIARAVGVADSRTARKFVERLAPRVEEARAKAQAAAATTPAAVTSAHPADAPEERERREARLSGDALLLAQHQVRVVVQLAEYTTKLAEHVREQAANIKTLDPERALKTINALSRLVFRTEQCATEALKLERVRRGDVTPIDLTLHVDEQVDANVVAAEARALLAAMEQRPEVAAAQTVAALPAVSA